jgi:chemotaxis protein MotB
MKAIPVYLILTLTTLVLLGPGCVPSKQFKQLEDQHNKNLAELDYLKGENQRLSVDNTEMSAMIEKLEKNIDGMAEDTVRLNRELRGLRGEFNQLTRQYNSLQQTQEAMIKGSAQETRRLLQQLQNTQNDLATREEDLRNLEMNLQGEKNKLDQLRFELEERNARLVELENILEQKDRAVNQLKDKVTTALLGYEDEGLTIDIKNGKVYVSLEEQLLFQSGSYQVDPKGRTALQKLALVLEQNRDVSVMIEGHTDDVPYIPGGGIQDNWDLSVKRATSIVRILLDGTTIDPKRLIAAGRGEFMPVERGTSASARQKNRRTEIILTPRLDELFRILESN